MAHDHEIFLIERGERRRSIEVSDGYVLQPIVRNSGAANEKA
jgi:hypothetical protein